MTIFTPQTEIHIRTIEWKEGQSVRYDWNTYEEVANYMGVKQDEFYEMMAEHGRADTPDVTAWLPYEPSETGPHNPFAQPEEEDGYEASTTREQIEAGARYLSTYLSAK